MNWIEDPAHHRWLEAETDRLFDFGVASRDPLGGFGWLSEDGALDASHDTELWITCRMTHVYALGDLMGRPEAASLVDHGIAALNGRLRDEKNGGWFAAVNADGPTVTDKEAYGHVFVVLAASSAAAAGRPGARELLFDALKVVDARFWDDQAGMSRESFSEDWSVEEQYRGINSNMHLVEAYIAAADVTGNPDLLKRALRITDRAIHENARNNNWRLPEHFTATWQPDLEYNKDDPAHRFRPYGATIGHWFEWARLSVQLAASIEQAGMAAPEWMIPDARALFDAAVKEGWNVDGAPGFVCTVDWSGKPVVRVRFHWVIAEAIAAAAALFSRTGTEEYSENYRSWWQFVGAHHLDRVGGSWWHELGPDNTVSRTVWTGKVDTYHALQSTLFARLPLNPALAPSLAAGNLR